MTGLLRTFRTVARAESEASNPVACGSAAEGAPVVDMAAAGSRGMSEYRLASEPLEDLVGAPVGRPGVRSS
jgi:hypothetical protein